MQPELCEIKTSHTLDKSMWLVHDIVRTKKDKIERNYSFGKREYPSIFILLIFWFKIF
jgi:hypothetical protein